MSCMGLGHLKPRNQAQESGLHQKNKKNNQSVSSCEYPKANGAMFDFRHLGSWCFLAQRLHLVMVGSRLFLGVGNRILNFASTCLSKVLYINSFKASPGRKFQAKKTISQRKTYVYQPPTSAMPKPFFVCTSLRPFHLVVFWWWLVVFA